MSKMRTQYHPFLREVPRSILEISGAALISIIIITFLNFGVNSANVITSISLFAVALIKFLPSANKVFHLSNI